MKAANRKVTTDKKEKVVKETPFLVALRRMLPDNLHKELPFWDYMWQRYVKDWPVYTGAELKAWCDIMPDEDFDADWGMPLDAVSEVDIYHSCMIEDISEHHVTFVVEPEYCPITRIRMELDDNGRNLKVTDVTKFYSFERMTQPQPSTASYYRFIHEGIPLPKP